MAYDRKDHYHQLAKREGYRSRAAYKLAEIQSAQKLLRRGHRVIDLGCWPGGWLQVAAEHVGAKGRVAGVDLAAVDPPIENANVFAIEGDIAEPAVHTRLLEFLGGKADVLLSDAAPKLTGIRVTDRAKEEALLEVIQWATPALLAPGGARLVKLLDCPEAAAFQKHARTHFETIKILKPKASRKGTAERYLLARNYHPPG